MVNFQHSVKVGVRSAMDPAKFINGGYSGRGMMGKRCPAITGSWEACQRSLAAIINLAAGEVIDSAMDADSDEDRILVAVADGERMLLTNMLMNFSTDNLGYDIVLYWPSVGYVD